jgi:hypothetical protein
VKDFETNLDVIRKSRLEAMVAEAQRRCENSLRMANVAIARAAAARGPADQADADRLLKLAMDQKKSDCDMFRGTNNLQQGSFQFGPPDPALTPLVSDTQVCPSFG